MIVKINKIHQLTLVRAEFLMRPRWRWRRNNDKHYKHPDSIGDA